MEWSISLSHQAERYLKQRHISNEVVFEIAQKAVARIFGEAVAIDLKALGGVWKGYHRARIGKIRIVFKINLDAQTLFVEVVENRDRVYKK